MNTKKPFGFCGTIDPPIKDVTEKISYDGGILIEIENGVFKVGYDKADDEDRAHKLAEHLIAAWVFRNNLRISVDFNQTWRTSATGGMAIGLFVSDGIAMSERLITSTVIKKSMSYVVKEKYDSYSFLNGLTMAEKAEKDETLSLVLEYFYNDISDPKTTMGGIHKAIEQIIKHIGKGNDKTGRSMLAGFAGCPLAYVEELMTSVQEKRHSKIWWVGRPKRPTLDQAECLTRAKKLIQAYTDSIPK